MQLWCRLYHLKVDLLLGSAQGSGEEWLSWSWPVVAAFLIFSTRAAGMKIEGAPARSSGEALREGPRFG